MLLTDKLTRLHNRVGFMRASERMLMLMDERVSSFMLLSINLAHLKFIEHALGQETAEQLLTRTADILRDVFQQNAVIGRWSADQFVVLNVEAPGPRHSSIAALNNRVDAATGSEDGLNLTLSGHFRVFDLRMNAGNVRFDGTHTVVH
jgi:diguanylate cyclase (GGDEF)-like protein